MLRWLYIQLIWLHPAPFRWQFGDDMLDDFDRTALRAKPRYFADAVASLGRQWLLRPEFRLPAATPVASAAVPLFQSIETYRPHPAALVEGGFLAMLSLLLAVLLIGKGGGIARPFFIGVHGTKPALLPINRNSLTGSDLDTTVKLGALPFEDSRILARSYFASMPILRALDANRDLMLSPAEIANAPSALRRLDANHDGKLTADEYGPHVSPSEQVPISTGRGRFVNYQPVVAALDANSDGEISPGEIVYAAASLRKLDRNHDGYLSADELIPFETHTHPGR